MKKTRGEGDGKKHLAMKEKREGELRTPCGTMCAAVLPRAALPQAALPRAALPRAALPPLASTDPRCLYLLPLAITANLSSLLLPPLVHLLPLPICPPLATPDQSLQTQRHTSTACKLSMALRAELLPTASSASGCILTQCIRHSVPSPPSEHLKLRPGYGELPYGYTSE